MSPLLLQIHIAYRMHVAALRDRLDQEVGEGVISTAIAVLIMAALGAVMWVGFQAIWGNASSQTTNQINQIGSSG